ncbi:hypothetical protein UP12_12690 [Bacillus pumilus]|uniref:hypothetical protein n=1 Tax=Bacillus TaxID=1386 RepID=UPI0007761EA8|nr:MULTISPECIES: hypothetical protein [Bacillus]AMM98162.1 hypothetical protein UP12_12690 [Bacillus pumilus]PAK33623.1 hypothetical protein CHI04_14360 [Bacillus safensis]
MIRKHATAADEILEFIRNRYEEYVNRIGGKKEDNSVHSNFLLSEKVGSTDHLVNKLISTKFNVPLEHVSEMTFGELKTRFEDEWSQPMDHSHVPEPLLKRLNKRTDKDIEKMLQKMKEGMAND